MFGGRSGFSAEALDALRDLSVNYSESEAPTPHRRGNWHIDRPTTSIGQEPPGPPVVGGPWEIARQLVMQYEFADPHVIRALYRPSGPLLGRDMLLEGRFPPLRFYMGVRITEVVDETRDDERIWGWGYQTLEGHLEQGRLRYEVIKNVRTGAVSSRIDAYSRRGEIDNPIIRIGFAIFGRRTQLRFYDSVGTRLKRSVQAVLDGRPAPTPVPTQDGLVIAPTTPGADSSGRFTLRAHSPGR